MVDAMGPTGIEGSYRRTLEVSLTLLRANKEVLQSVLEPFLRDPTVCWSRHGRAQGNLLPQQTPTGKRRNHNILQNNNNNNGKNSKTAIVLSENENTEANEMLKKIRERLEGVYNVVHPLRQEILQGYYRRKETIPAIGLGSKPEERFPLSVTGQVKMLFLYFYLIRC